jgi:hypothetical protein
VKTELVYTKMTTFTPENLLLIPGFLIIVTFIAIWELVWKVIGAVAAGKNKDWVWMVFIIVFNTAGILPIIYLIVKNGYRKRRRRR